MSDDTLDAVARALLDAPFPCVLTSLRADGSPVSVVMWCGRDGDLATVNAGEGTAWLTRIRRDPRVSLAVVDTANILHAVTIQGEVVAIDEDVDYAHMDTLARCYDGTERYVWSRPEEQTRYRVAIRPARVSAFEIDPPAAVKAARRP